MIEPNSACLLVETASDEHIAGKALGQEFRVQPYGPAVLGEWPRSTFHPVRSCRSV